MQSKINIDKQDFYKPDVKVLEKHINDKRMLNFELYSLKVEGTMTNTHPAFINGLLRAIFEMPHYALTCEYKDIEKEDQNINNIMLIDNIKAVPLRYGIDENLRNKLSMRIDIKNTTDDDDFYVKTGDIKFNKEGEGMKPIFLSNFPLISLARGKRLVVKNISIENGKNSKDIRFSPITATYSASSTKSLREMENGMTLRDFTFKFHINSVLDKDKNITTNIIKQGRDDLVNRLTRVLEVVKTKDIEFVDIRDDKLTINYDENQTIAQILYIGLNLELKDCTFISRSSEIDENMQLIIIYPDVQENVIAVIEKIIIMYNNIL